MIVDQKALPHPYVVSTLLGKYGILEVSVPPLDLPILLFPSGLQEEMSGTSDPLMDVAHTILLASMPGLTPPIFSLPSLSKSAGSLITLILVLSSVLLAATAQIPVPTIALPVPPL